MRGWICLCHSLLAMVAALLFAGCAAGSRTTTTVAGPPPPEPTYALHFNVQPNSSASFRMNVQSQFIQEVMGTENVLDSEWKSVLTQHVGAADAEGNVTVDIRFDSMAVQVSNPMLAAMVKPLQEVAGKSVQAVLSRNGEVLRLQGLETLPAAANQNNQMENTLRNLFPRFATNAIKVGESWTRDDTSRTKTEATDMTIVNHSDYSLASVTRVANRTHLKLHNASTFAIQGTVKNQGADVGLSGTGKAEGDFTVDYATGWLFSANATSESSGTAEVNMGQPVSIPWRSNNSVAIVRK